ncbi:hypothetical protein B0H14DRAFT_2221360, partial [Mycena olivaceomarginata]
TSQLSTLRRHLERFHKPEYYAWCRKENFESMLPCDTAARRAKVAISIGIQSTLDGHMGPCPAATKKVKYSAETFQDAAVKWIIATDQPIGATTNPHFREMIEIASRVTDGV